MVGRSHGMAYWLKVDLRREVGLEWHALVADCVKSNLFERDYRGPSTEQADW